MQTSFGYRLGVDLGSTSLGWAMVSLQDGEPHDLINWGVRIFPDGRDNKSKTPLQVERRLKRSARRRRDRYIARREALMRTLVGFGLMPELEADRKRLEREDPLEIRANAASKPVSLYQIGRALFHINQRRGFKSNRKVDRKQEDTATKAGILALKAALGERTLGEFLYERTLTKKSTRFRPTARGNKNEWEFYPERWMVEDEIRRIWATQSAFHTSLTDEMLARLIRIIVEQRPLKRPERGKCLFLHDKERCRSAHPSFQKFRILQELNNLQFEFGLPISEGLRPDQRRLIAQHLLYDPAVVSKATSKHTLKFSTIRRLLKVDTSHSFNLEKEGRDHLKADATAGELAGPGAFGRKWFQLTPDEQDEVVEQIIETDDEETLVAWLMERHGLARENAVQAARANLEDGFSRLSREAIEQILPFLEEGLIYSEACARAGFNHSQRKAGELLAHLPYYGEYLPEAVLGALPPDRLAAKAAQGGVVTDEDRFGRINNPTVHVALNQLRKVVNAIIDRYGPPTEIAIELARELPVGPEQQREMERQRKLNRKRNDAAAEEVGKTGTKVNYVSIERYKLWEESSPSPVERCCPFCGTQIELSRLFSPDFEIEHLLPFSRTYDDSLGNKVVSCRICNKVKGNRTPWEAFGHTPDWEQIVARSERFPRNRRWRFQHDAMARFDEENNGMIARLLNDTRYMSRLATKYLVAICNRVDSSTGQATAILRRCWGLNQLLGSDEKNRSDLRHHAVDAFIIACTTRSLVKRISTAAAALREADPVDIKRVIKAELPYGSFKFEDLMLRFGTLVVSHKLDRGDLNRALKSGATLAPLHKETYFGPISAEGSNERVRVRVPVLSLKGSDTTSIVSSKIRRDLEGKLSDKQKENVPFLEDYSARTGVRRVRILQEINERSLVKFYDKSGRYYKAAAAGGNFAMDIYCPAKGPDAGTWQFYLASNFDAHRPSSQPPWKKDHPTAKLIMRLQINDTVAVGEGSKRRVLRVKQTSQDGRIMLIPLHLNSEKDMIKYGAYRLQKEFARKVYVNEIGSVRDPRPVA